MHPEDRNPPNTAELEAAIPHLAFEQAAMRSSASCLATPGARFAFEAFLVHVRVLRAFYFDQWSSASRWAESTIVAELYCRNPADWRTVKASKKTPRLQATKDPIDKQLAHLTKERAQAFTDLQASVGSLQQELESLWDHFVTTLAKERDVEPFRRALAEKCLELGCP